MKTIPTKNGELLCVEVPMDAVDLNVFENELQWYYCDDRIGIAEIPEGCEIIGTITNGVLDFDAEPYVKSGNYRNDPVLVGVGWFDYKHLDYRHSVKEYSFLSLIDSHNVEYSGKKIVILSKK